MTYTSSSLSESNEKKPPLTHSSKASNEEEPSRDNEPWQEELGISSNQFQTIFSKLSQVGIALSKTVYDENGVPVDFIMLEVSPSYEKMFSVKRKLIILEKATQVNSVLTAFTGEWIEICGRVAKTGSSEQYEVYLRSQDKWYQVYSYSPKKDFVISVFMDLSERKKAEQQFVNSEKWYRRLYETSQDGIMARDLKGRMIGCNRAYAKMLGYSKKELRQLSVQQLLPEKWHEQREKIVKQVLATGRSIVFEREYERRDGSIFPASVRTWRLKDGKGKVIGIWSIVRDITNQKKLQKNLEKQAEILNKIIEERTKQLKDSERLAAIGQTAGMVGHDLRNPLQTVIGELFLAKGEVVTLPECELKNNLQENIQAIEEQALYMDKIVSDLQAFVRPIKIDKEAINLKELVSGVLTAVNIPANIKKRVHLKADFPKVKGDQQLLKRVLINLVTNAVQAMPEGGKLTLKLQLNSQNLVVISVGDTGIGIPEKIKPQIFTPLFTTKPRGQGFGLAVCRRVIEAHGGSIKFESQEGKGTKFTIQFPSN